MLTLRTHYVDQAGPLKFNIFLKSNYSVSSQRIQSYSKNLRNLWILPFGHQQFKVKENVFLDENILID